jgi:DNA/RNA endonuclease G (NUC1)
VRVPQEYWKLISKFVKPAFEQDLITTTHSSERILLHNLDHVSVIAGIHASIA